MSFKYPYKCKECGFGTLYPNKICGDCQYEIEQGLRIETK